VTDDDTRRLTDEQVLPRLTWLLGLIDELTARYQARPLTTFGRPGSDIAADDEALGALSPSYRIGNCFMIALDQLHIVRVLLQPDPQGPIVVPFIGPYPNTRAALEAASLAVYLLDPDPVVRRERALTAAWDGVLQNERTIKAMCALTDDDDKAARSRKTKEQAGGMLQIKQTKRDIRLIGAFANINDSAYTKALPGFRTIVHNAAHGMSFSGDDARFVWGQMSGMAHPSFERNSNLAPQVSTGADGQDYTHEPRAQLVFLQATIDMAITVLTKALELASQRGNDLTIRFVMLKDTPDPPNI